LMSDHELSEARLKMLQFTIDIIPHAVYWITLDNRIWNCNAAGCRMLGYDREELLSLSVQDVDPDYSPEDGRADLEERRRTGVLHLKRHHRTKDGRIIPVEVTSKCFLYDDDQCICWIVRDISELLRVQAEQEKMVEGRTAELAEIVRELRFTQFAIDRTQDQAFWMTEDGRFFYVNEAACRSLGYSREELLGMSVPDINPTCSPEEFPGYWKEAREKGPLTFETMHRTKDGRVFPVEIRANHVVFDGREYNCAFGTDISERKRLEKALRAAEAEKSLILNSTMDYVWFHDPDMKIVWVNWKASEVLKLPVEEIIGRHCWAVVHKRDEPCEECPVMLARDTGKPQKMEKYCPNGLILNMRAYPIWSEDGRLLGIAEFVNDITQHKRAQDALQKAHAELESRVRERTEQLSSLTAELSLAEERERRRIATELHDQVGQTLIMSKIGLDSLSQNLQAADFEVSVGEIRHQIARSLEDIRSLTFQLSPPLLYEVGLEAALEWLGEEFENKYGFLVEFQDDGKKKPLNEETGVAIYQMVRELLINAARHAGAKKVGISVEKVSRKIRIGVMDDGVGFDASNGMRRSKRGFGLFNVRQRIEYMGGKFEIESTSGQGTRIRLLLPLGKKDKCICSAPAEGSRDTRSKGPHKPIPRA
jgi:PAS domain S-box-containing protein